MFDFILLRFEHVGTVLNFLFLLYVSFGLHIAEMVGEPRPSRPFLHVACNVFTVYNDRYTMFLLNRLTLQAYSRRFCPRLHGFGTMIIIAINFCREYYEYSFETFERNM